MSNPVINSAPAFPQSSPLNFAIFPAAFYEDVEFALRAARFGGGLRVVTDVSVTHHHGMGTHGSSRTADTSTQRDVLLERAPQISWTQPRRPDALR